MLIGDAAHPTTPNLGGGVHGHRRRRESWPAACGARGLGAQPGVFVAERSPRTSAITRGSWRFGRLGQWGGRLPCWLRDRLFGLLLPLVEPRGLLSYATFDVGPLPTAGPAGANLRE